MSQKTIVAISLFVLLAATITMILAVLDMEEREEKRKLISAVSTQSGYIVGQKIITVSSERRNGMS